MPLVSNRALLLQGVMWSLSACCCVSPCGYGSDDVGDPRTWVPCWTEAGDVHKGDDHGSYPPKGEPWGSTPTVYQKLGHSQMHRRYMYVGPSPTYQVPWVPSHMKPLLLAYTLYSNQHSLHLHMCADPISGYSHSPLYIPCMCSSICEPHLVIAITSVGYSYHSTHL